VSIREELKFCWEGIRVFVGEFFSCAEGKEKGWKEIYFFGREEESMGCAIETRISGN
jgi:hypothetical protein